MVMALAKNALIEFDGSTGRLYIDGDEFPYDVVAFELRTERGDTFQTLAVTIPLEQGAMVVYEHGLPPQQKVETPVDDLELESFGKVGDTLRVNSTTSEPDRGLVFHGKFMDHDTGTTFLRYVDNDFDGPGWFFGPENGYDSGWGPWTWSDLSREFPGEYEIVWRDE